MNIRMAIKAFILPVLMLSFVGAAHANPSWSVLTTQTDATVNSLRGLAVSWDGSIVYGGYIQTSGNREIRAYDSVSGSLLYSTSTGLGAYQPKGIATDDRGYVFASATSSTFPLGQFRIYNSDLSSLLFSSGNTIASQIGGIATWKSGTSYYLYIAYEDAARTISRFNVTNVNAPFLDTTFGTAGSYNVAGAGVLNGINVAADGTIYQASRNADQLFRISSDLTSSIFTTVNRAMDSAYFDGRVYVTQYSGQTSAIAVLDATTLGFIQTLTTGIPRGTAEGYSGIDIGPDGRIFVADQLFQSSGTRSDRILVSTPIPEPAFFQMGALAAMSGLGLLRLRRKS